MQPTLSHQNSKGASNLNLQAKNSQKKKTTDPYALYVVCYLGK
jgi:hypothetical protein